MPLSGTGQTDSMRFYRCWKMPDAASGAEPISASSRRMDNAFGWAVFSGAYGLCFGGLCAAVYLVAKTPAFTLSWWLSGLSYDVMHGAGNFVIMLLLYRPLRTALQTAKRQIRL